MGIDSSACWRKYGDPYKHPNMTVFSMPVEYKAANGDLPSRIYINKDAITPLRKALSLLIARGLIHEIVTFDGCHNIRKIRNGDMMSLHSWGVAIDWNASSNVMGKSYDQLIKAGVKPFSDEFLQCWRDTGWDCGGDWQYPDRMHVQLRSLT